MCIHVCKLGQDKAIKTFKGHTVSIGVLVGCTVIRLLSAEAGTEDS